MHKVYDVYVIGQLDDWYSMKDTNGTYDRDHLRWETLYFKIEIGEPWTLLHNTPPTVNFIPYQIFLKPGDEFILKLGEA